MKRLRSAITSSWVVYVGAGVLMMWVVRGAALTFWDCFALGAVLPLAHIAGRMYAARLYEAKLNRQRTNDLARITTRRNR